MVGTDIEVEEVDHLAEADPVDEVSQGAGKDHPQGDCKQLIFVGIDAQVMEDEADGGQGDADEEDVAEGRRGPGKEAEGRPGVPDVGDAEESRDHGNRLVEGHARMDDVLGDLIEDQQPRHSRQKDNISFFHE